MKFNKRYRFTISSFNDLLEDIVKKRISRSTAESALMAHLQNENFLQMIFNPPDDVDRDQLQKETQNMYILLAHRKVLNCIMDAIEYEEYDSFSDLDRSVGTFLNTIALAGVQASKDFEARTKKDFDSGEISRSEAKEEYRHIEMYNDSLEKLIRMAVKIVKKKAKYAARESNIPTRLSRNVFLMVPDPRFMNRYQIGFYMNRVLTEIYGTVEEYEVDLRRADWGEFFKEVFGEKNVVEVANYILLEGLDRMQDYKRSEVKEVWNDLTKFALDALENAPTETQEQMLDLYTKRIARMFQNNTFELRADLRNLDPTRYPSLSETILKYADKITDIIKSASEKK